MSDEPDFKEILKTLPIAIYEIDYLGPRFRNVNDAMCRLSGYSREELLEMDPLEFLLPESLERFKDRIKRALAGEELEEDVEYQAVIKGGHEISVILKVMPIFKNQKFVGAWVVAFDITERKETEEALRRLQIDALEALRELKKTKVALEENAVSLEEYASRMEELANQRANQLKDAERFAAIVQSAGMVGHDIRNPLQAITGNIFLAKNELLTIPNCDEKTNLIESLDEIEKNVAYINKIVQDLQDFARPVHPVAREVNLQRLIDEVITKSNLPTNVNTYFKIQEGLESVSTDNDLLKRILINLVTNAVQAMPDGGTISVVACRFFDGVNITVQDTGKGIPEEIRSKIFAPLFTTKSKGQGFGLAVVKRMTEALGGNVTFESETGKGTAFIVHLPLSKENLSF